MTMRKINDDISTKKEPEPLTAGDKIGLGIVYAIWIWFILSRII